MIDGFDYWYDSQIKRYLEQVIRGLSGFKYATGRRNGNDPELKIVPVRMASRDRMVSHIMRNLSENTLLTVPLITVYMTDLEFRREDLQYPAHVSEIQVHERKIDPITQKYTEEKGNKYSVKRLMPRPYSMTINVDIWTSNLDQKLQLSEQILTIFAPSISIQNSENTVDWSALSDLQLENINWSSKTIPVGTSDDLDVFTITFKLPFWLNPPALVTQQKIIEQIVTNINEGDPETTSPDAGNRWSRIIITPENHHIKVENGIITLLNERGRNHDDNGNPYNWNELLSLYGTYKPNISTITLKTGDDIEDTVGDIIGTVQVNPSNVNELLWQIDIDTLPLNTLSPISGIINPLKTHPLDGLPAPSAGDRYLLLHDVGPSQAWGNLSARENDIIEYQSGEWVVSFEAEIATNNQYVLNQASGKQLRFVDKNWVIAIDGEYSQGYWRISL